MRKLIRVFADRICQKILLSGDASWPYDLCIGGMLKPKFWWRRSITDLSFVAMISDRCTAPRPTTATGPPSRTTGTSHSQTRMVITQDTAGTVSERPKSTPRRTLNVL